jgi:N-acetyl-gamma-glutamyl-phosphate reductase
MLNAAVIGASGYSGAELLRLLTARDDVVIRKAFAATSAGQRVDAVYPVFTGRLDLTFESYSDHAVDGADVAFVALPSGEAMTIVPGLLGQVPRVIDLGGDFRLPSADLYEEYYRHRHAAPALLSEAVYGLPELNKEAIAKARLVANPGCYPTGALLGLIPALKNEVITPESVVISALSGVSGAGRSSAVELSFSEVNENVRAYKVGNHQHIPEIQTVLEQVAGKPVPLTFVPHLIPVTRGIYSTIYATLNVQLSAGELAYLYENFYAGSPFVRIKKQIPQVKDVLNTNYCDVYATVEPRTRRAIIITVIDNLVKGAAGQAVQNMNIMFGLPEEKGLQ